MVWSAEEEARCPYRKDEGWEVITDASPWGTGGWTSSKQTAWEALALLS